MSGGISWHACDYAMLIAPTGYRNKTMAFKNEYVLPLEEENSEFIKMAREKLKKGGGSTDAWTVDRDNNRVLSCSGRGHDIDSQGEEYWQFLDGDKRYSFTTMMVNDSLISQGPPQIISITRDIITFWGQEPYAGLPDDKTIQYVRDAFLVYGAYCMAYSNIQCQHNLLWNGGPPV